MTSRDPLLTATGIAKTFDRTRALAGAQFDLMPGEVHGLLGANGAGKSTLSKVIAGHVIPDEGQLVYRGQPLRLRSTRDALDNGIAIVMQETSLVPDLSVAENIFLPELGRKGRGISYAGLHRRGASCWRPWARSTFCRSTSRCGTCRRLNASLWRSPRRLGSGLN